MDFQWPTKLGSKSSSTAHLFMAALALILFDQLFKEKSRSKNAVEWTGGDRDQKFKHALHFLCMYILRVPVCS